MPFSDRKDITKQVFAKRKSTYTAPGDGILTLYFKCHANTNGVVDIRIGEAHYRQRTEGQADDTTFSFPVRRDEVVKIELSNVDSGQSYADFIEV